jgi:superoxide dismutase
LLRTCRRETLEYHYGKHHQAYVTNLNNLIKGTEYEALDLEAIIRKAPAGGIYNNSAQVWNHTFLLELPDTQRRRRARPAHWRPPSTPNGAPSPSSAKAFQASAVGNFGSGWTWLVKKADGSVDIVNMGAAGTPLTTGDKACSASTSGSTPTTSTIATCARSSSRPSSRALPTGASPSRTSPARIRRSGNTGCLRWLR